MKQVAALREIMLVLYRRLGQLQKDEICCYGVTVPQCYALQLLHRQRQMTAGELALQLGVDASTMTRAADVLVRRGALERARPESGDRRRVILRLTKEGRALTRKLIAYGDTCFESLLKQFPGRERDGIIRALGRLAAALERTGGCCGTPDTKLPTKRRTP